MTWIESIVILILIPILIPIIKNNQLAELDMGHFSCLTIWASA